GWIAGRKGFVDGFVQLIFAMRRFVLQLLKSDLNFRWIQHDFQPSGFSPVKGLECLYSILQGLFLRQYACGVDLPTDRQVDQVRNVTTVWTVAHAYRQIFIHGRADREAAYIFGVDTNN